MITKSYYSQNPELAAWDYAHSSTIDTKYLTSTCYLFSCSQHKDGVENFHQRIGIWVYKNPDITKLLPMTPVQALIHRIKTDHDFLQNCPPLIREAFQVAVELGPNFVTDKNKPLAYDTAHVGLFSTLLLFMEKCAGAVDQYETFCKLAPVGITEKAKQKLYARICERHSTLQNNKELPHVDFVREFYNNMVDMLGFNEDVHFAVLDVKLNLSEFKKKATQYAEKSDIEGVSISSIPFNASDSRKITLSFLQMPNQRPFLPTPEFATERDMLEYIDEHCDTLLSHTPILG